MHPVLNISIQNYPTQQVLMSASCVRRSCLTNYPERLYFPLLIPKAVPLLSSFPQHPHRSSAHPCASPHFGNAPGGALCTPWLGYVWISPLGLWCPPSMCPVHSGWERMKEPERKGWGWQIKIIFASPTKWSHCLQICLNDKATWPSGDFPWCCTSRGLLLFLLIFPTPGPIILGNFPNKSLSCYRGSEQASPKCFPTLAHELFWTEGNQDSAGSQETVTSPLKNFY